jgi:hypothetical protein
MPRSIASDLKQAMSKTYTIESEPATATATATAKRIEITILFVDAHESTDECLEMEDLLGTQLQSMLLHNNNNNNNNVITITTICQQHHHHQRQPNNPPILDIQSMLLVVQLHV